MKKHLSIFIFVWALINSNNIIENIIEYDGTSTYVPADGMTLQQVTDDKKIGDSIDE